MVNLLTGPKGSGKRRAEGRTGPVLLQNSKRTTPVSGYDTGVFSCGGRAGGEGERQ